MIIDINNADVGNHEMMKTLSFISEKLPTYMWLSNLYSSGHKIDLTIKTENEDTGVISSLGLRNYFKVENIKKKRNRDGSVSISLSLFKLQKNNIGEME